MSFRLTSITLSTILHQWGDNSMVNLLSHFFYLENQDVVMVFECN